MSKIRTVKPEFPKDEIVGAMSRDVRLLYILLFNFADDEGRFRASPALIRSELFPYDEDLSQHVVGDWLADLERLGRVRFYVHGEQQYGHIVNLRKHQRIDHPTPSKLPAPTAENIVSSNDLPHHSHKTSRDRNVVEGKGKGEEGSREPAASPRPDRPPGSTPDFPTFVDAFDSRFRVATGAKPSWGAKEGKQVKALLSRQPLAECLRRLGIFFGPDRPGWLTSYDLATFLQHFDKFATATGPPKRAAPRDPSVDRLLAIRNGANTDDRSGSSRMPSDAQGLLPSSESRPRRADSGGD